ncbi:MAG TPA: site-specific DNA-methyltransferase [Candidatus Acidoferrales bacterium]|nr:site-specific DNA-methyltransferase [Candidatus Acidoferrales bacterium]
MPASRWHPPVNWNRIGFLQMLPTVKVLKRKPARYHRPLRTATAREAAAASDFSLNSLVAKYLPDISLHPLEQEVIPRLAKDAEAIKAIQKAIKEIPTQHDLWLGDSRNMSRIPSESVHLVVTSPPYFDLKRYPERDGQLGELHSYEAFLESLEQVWHECHRVLVKGGRLVVVVGDVCRSRRAFGAHMVVPLHASIMEQCRHIGFHSLATLIWHKIANAAFEVENGTSFLGKPYEPNAIIKNDIEFILMQRKPGGYRRPTDAMRVLSVIGEKLHRKWFKQIITVRGASTRTHPAPYPLELVEPIIRMFSFVGDTVLDPFSGTGTTTLAALRCGRNSIGIEIEPTYHQMAINRINEAIWIDSFPATLMPDRLVPPTDGEREI